MSAFLVALGHALAIVNSKPGGSRVLTWIADMRGPAVVVFFVLSGFLVGGSVIKNIERLDFTKYLISRTSRIYIVLFPALLLTVLLDGIVKKEWPSNQVYAQVWQGGALGDSAIFSRYSVQNVLGSVLSIEPLTGPPMGSAGSLWSLGYEWIFYFLFPALTKLGFALGRWRGVLLSLGVSVVAGFILSPIGTAFWVVWLLGAAANVVRMSVLIRSSRIEAAAKWSSLLGMVVMVAVGEHINQHQRVPLIGLFAVAFLCCNKFGEDRFTWRLDKKLADFSYSLYVTHLQLESFIAAVLLQRGLLPASGVIAFPISLAFAFALLLPSLLLALAFGYLFEARTHKLARWLKGKFDADPYLIASKVSAL